MVEVRNNAPGQVRVMAGLQPLLITDKATVVEFRDRFGDLNALFCRHFTDDMWIFVTRDDPDWSATLVRLGYTAAPMTTEQLVDNVVRNGMG